MRLVLVTVMIAGLFGCRAPSAVPAPSSIAAGAELRAPTSFRLTHLDGRSLPTRYDDPRGTYTLSAGELRFDIQGHAMLVLDQVGTGDFSSGPTGRTTVMTSYRFVSADSLLFPVDSAGVAPEFFGKLRGTQLLLVARPTRKPGVNSIARERGGAHT